MAKWPDLWRQNLVTAIAAALILALSAGSAAAHPHVWIDSKTRLIFDQGGRVVALEVDWRFDEFYSLFAVEGLDKDEDGVLSPAELYPLAELNVTSLESYRYFTYVSVNGAEADYGKVKDFGSKFEDGILSLRFVLPLRDAVDPRNSQLSFTSYDPSFYISIEPWGQAPVVFADGAPEGCGFDLERGGETETLNIADADLIISGAQNIAAQFAARISVNCGAPVATQ